MATPATSRPALRRFLGNSNRDHVEVHDLQNEKNSCQIDEIVAAGNAVVFEPDSLAQAHSEGYDNCGWCIA
jgi:hypothetical protein